MSADESRPEAPESSLLAGITMRRAIIVVLAVYLGGWLVFDGMRAFTVGDYLTPDSGDRAGMLGPWADVLGAIGIAARSGGAKALHVISGLVWLGAALLDLRGGDRRRIYLFTLPFGLWYLPFGSGIAIACAIMAVTEKKTPPADADGVS